MNLKRLKHGIGMTLLFTLATLWLLVTGLPFYYMLQTGFKEQFEFLSSSPMSLPGKLYLDNFKEVLKHDFVRYFINSVTVVSISVFVLLVISAMAAYVFSRIDFPLKRPLFALMIAGLIVPVHVTLIPVYLLISRIGLYDTIGGLIGPYVAFGIPLSVIILTEFMRQIPRELQDAARIDGCDPFRMFFTIILPLSKSALVTVAIYNAIGRWNEFVFAYVLTTDPRVRTLPLAVWEFQGMFSMNVPAIMALLTLSALPVIIAYAIGQEQIVRGIMAGALQGR